MIDLFLACEEVFIKLNVFSFIMNMWINMGMNVENWSTTSKFYIATVALLKIFIHILFISKEKKERKRRFGESEPINIKSQCLTLMPTWRIMKTNDLDSLVDQYRTKIDSFKGTSMPTWLTVIQKLVHKLSCFCQLIYVFSPCVFNLLV